jgi:transcriptional regulator with XRE-family HTH domain
MTTREKNHCGLKDLQEYLGAATLGGFLRSWRLSEELSQAKFAAIINMSPANLCDIEKGRTGVSSAKAHQIAKKIGYSAKVLIELALQQQLRSAGLKYRVTLACDAVRARRVA